jgi:hypothetical protein
MSWKIESSKIASCQLRRRQGKQEVCKDGGENFLCWDVLSLGSVI